MTKAMIGLTALALAMTLALGPRSAAAQCCGDCNGDDQVTVDEVTFAVNHLLEGCKDDGICNVGGCTAQLATCKQDLADCQAQPRVRQLPASQQTTSYGAGSDGAVRAGATLTYTDNGNGAITDTNTGLIWEKKDDAGGIHDMDNTYTWGMSSGPYTMDGTMVTEFLATLNQVPCFAGHCDWRIPNVKELQSIIDYELAYPGPAVNAVFDSNCTAGCAVAGVGGPMCSCTDSNDYWSSTTDRYGPYFAWLVNFRAGGVKGDFKSTSLPVRAVRGGM